MPLYINICKHATTDKNINFANTKTINNGNDNGNGNITKQSG